MVMSGILNVTKKEIKMKITNSEFRDYKNKNLLAFGVVTFDDMLTVRNLRIQLKHDGSGDRFVGWPSHEDKKEKGNFYEDTHPSSGKARKIIGDEIIALYDKHAGNTGASAPESEDEDEDDSLPF